MNLRNPLHSSILHVLETKKGNQILLAIIYLIIAQRLDLPIYGIRLPEYFILAYLDEDQRSNTAHQALFYINPLHKGGVFDEAELNLFLQRINRNPF